MTAPLEADAGATEWPRTEDDRAGGDSDRAATAAEPSGLRGVRGEPDRTGLRLSRGGRKLILGHDDPGAAVAMAMVGDLADEEDMVLVRKEGWRWG